MEKLNGPMSYDYHKPLTAEDIIKARREVAKYVKERDARLKELRESEE